MGYLDPGLFGILSQLGLAAFLVVVSAVAFFFKPIKTLFRRVFKKDSVKQPESTTGKDETDLRA